MRILFVSSYFGYKSGFNKAAGDILFCLLKSSHEVTVLTHYNKIPLPNKNHNSFKIITAPWNLTFPTIKDIYGLRNLAKWLYRSMQDVIRNNYYKKVRDFNPEIIIVNSYSNYLLPKIKYNKNISIFISHGDVESSRLSTNSESNVDNTIILLQQFDYLVFVSNLARNEWLSFESLTSKPTYYIPNCSNEETAKNIMQKSKKEVQLKLGFNPLNFNVVCVANISYRKGQDFLINNFSKIYGNIPNVNLYCVGDARSDYAIKLKQEVKLKWKNNEITFCGVKKNALDYIYAADLFVLPSRAEALPLVILEAMLLQTPVLASNVSGIPEMIKDGYNGFLFSLDNFDDFIFKLLKLHKYLELRELFTKNSKLVYWNSFCREKQIKHYYSLLANCCNKY